MDELGFGIIGVGNIAAVHGRALGAVPGARLRAFLGRDEAATRAMAARFGVDATTDAAAFFARPDIQVVTICTPSGTHAELGVQAARAGKHVMVEKPIDVTLEKARALLETCEQQGVRLGVIFQSRFLPAVALVGKAIARGRLGRLFVADGYVKWYRAPEYYQDARWRGTKALDGGGALINQAIHTVDLVQHLAGEARQVFGFTARMRHTGIEGEDTAVAVVRYASGAMGVLEATTSTSPGFARRVELHGERGTIVLDGNDVSVWRLDGSDEEEVELERLRASSRDASDGSSNPMNLDTAAHGAQFTDFVAALREGRAPLVDGRAGLGALALVRAVYRSAETGQRVDLD